MQLKMYDRPIPWVQSLNSCTTQGFEHIKEIIREKGG